MPTWTVLYRDTVGQIQTVTVYAYSPLGASREAERLVGDDITVLNCVTGILEPLPIPHNS